MARLLLGLLDLLEDRRWSQLFLQCLLRTRGLLQLAHQGFQSLRLLVLLLNTIYNR